MTRIFVIVIVILSVAAGVLYLRNMSLKSELSAANGQIALKDEYIFTLEYAVKDLQNNIAIYAKADEQAEEFNKELINDETTDNLDVVPADYILKQLHAD